MYPTRRGYKEGEYKTFEYKGQIYRYLASDIDTKKKYMTFLNQAILENLDKIRETGEPSRRFGNSLSQINWQ
ncbi:hypothetical protein GNT69_22470 [Bacillus sp. B15-48]|nr:hypothetical protein [Bacillus sp. B15-48]